MKQELEVEGYDEFWEFITEDNTQHTKKTEVKDC
jgi:hypothetical protein